MIQHIIVEAQPADNNHLRSHYLRAFVVLDRLWAIGEPTTICDDLGIRWPATAVAGTYPPVIGGAIVRITRISVLQYIAQ